MLLTDWREVPFLPSPLNKPLSSYFIFFNEYSAEKNEQLESHRTVSSFT